MVKVIVLLSRRPGMSREDFLAYLKDEHLPKVAKMPGIKRLVVNAPLLDPNQPEPPYDAVAEDWFEDTAAMDAVYATPEGKAVLNDAPTFLDMSRFVLLVVAEEEMALAS